MTSRTSLTISNKKNRQIPVLITWDVDPDLWISLERRQWALNTAVELCHSLGIPATFFTTAKSAHFYLKEIEKMQVLGHEIGCHGLTHGNEEDYNRMSEEMQRAYIGEATEKLQSLTGTPITAFRSPRVKTSATTLRLLAEYDYLSDSSVCSQRMDLVSSNLINVNWIFSPRYPYRPHQNSAFKKGDVPIWEIPISAALVPFISSALKVLGLPLMKMLFRLLYAEARLTNKPIVYLAHPTEFIGSKRKKEITMRRRLAKYLKSEYFSPSFIRVHGFRMRNLLYNMDAEVLLNSTHELFSYMSSFPDVKFMTVSEYTTGLNQANLVPISQRVVF